MQRKRRNRCPYCGELFWPDARTRWRQWACGKPECQKRRRQETQRHYRERHRGESQARRYREEVAAAKSGSYEGPKAGRNTGITECLLWEEIKDEIAPQLYVTLVFIAELIFASVRDERSRQLPMIKGERGKYTNEGMKDEMGESGHVS
jgi:plasmid stabilization system protein ParE